MIRESLNNLDMTNATGEQIDKLNKIKEAYDELIKIAGTPRDLVSINDLITELQKHEDCSNTTVVIRKDSNDITLKSTDIKNEDGVIRVYI